MRAFLTAIAAAGLPALVTAQSLYFPPNGPNGTWETVDPATLGWCQPRIDSLFAYLDAQHTKGFMVLKDGRIALEHYFGSFTQDSLWYWASAGKALTATTVGAAQEDGFLNILDPTSTYLGPGWTSASETQETAINVRHQLTMTTGLNDAGPDNNCAQPSCLTFFAVAGTRWAYHTGPYALLHPVVANATGQTFSSYFNTRIRDRIGMTGLWLTNSGTVVYFSNLRSMARFGLLAMNNMVWDGDTVLHDTAFVHASISPSQQFNRSYGYLWWLNGQPGFMLPQTQIVFPGPLIPNAPMDTYSALGKNDQIINVSPAQGLVLVRMGNAAGTSAQVSTVFDNMIWQNMNNLDCTAGVDELQDTSTAKAYPNPASGVVSLALPAGVQIGEVRVSDSLGRTVLMVLGQRAIDLSGLTPGVYTIATEAGGQRHISRVVKE